jgi:methylmalonyl-CoA/ethylmalonyl-CoA epimerase
VTSGAGLVFDHVGLVVPDLDSAMRQLRATTGAVEATARFDDPGLTVSVRFLRDRAGMVYELIAPFGEGSVVAATLARKRDLLNQLAYRTADLAKAVQHLRGQGCMPLGAPAPALAFGGAQVQFLFNPLGFVLELIEDTAPPHQFRNLEPLS